MTTYDHISANRWKTAILMSVFIGLVVLLGYFLDRQYGGGGAYIGLAGIYALVSALVSYYAGDKIALASSGAQVVTETDNPYLYRMLQNLTIATGSPMPKVYVINDDAINAFATGRDPKHASIAVTTGALKKLANEELEGVLAHELSHVRNYDIRLMMVVAVLVGTIVIVSDMFFRARFFGGGRRSRDNGGGILAIIGLVLLILSPIIAEMIKLAVSRRREYLADASAALITRYPDGLANALLKIEQDATPLARASKATAHLYIANPFSSKSFAAAFSTHPPIAERVAALRKMSGTGI